MRARRGLPLLRLVEPVTDYLERSLPPKLREIITTVSMLDLLRRGLSGVESLVSRTAAQSITLLRGKVLAHVAGLAVGRVYDQGYRRFGSWKEEGELAGSAPKVARVKPNLTAFSQP
jgi:hypothetical protein